MVRVETNTVPIQVLFKKNVNPNGDMFEGDKINISSAFQRGDEETGVWDKKMKSGFIDSLLNHFPTGILTFVKDYSISTSYQEPWFTLDGGNRMRTIRDFIMNRFENNEGSKFSDMDPEVRAEFNNILVPCQWLSIERDDPPETISQMFTRLNTSAKPLSQGELLKAHGWKSNIFEIELAKYIVGGCWDSVLNDENTFEGFTELVNDFKIYWNGCFGTILETKRCDTLAMITAFIISSKTKELKYFDKRFSRISCHLSTSRMTKIQIVEIIEKMLTLVKIVDQLGENKFAALGKFTKGIPSQSKIAAIWYTICQEELDALLEKRIVWFYNQLAESEELKNEFSNIVEKSGNNETTQSKIIDTIEFIESKTEHIE